MEERFMEGGVHKLLIFDLVFQDTKKILPVLPKLSLASLVKFIFRWVEGGSHGTPNGGVTVSFLVLAYSKLWTFSSTCSTSPIIMKVYQQVRSLKRSKLAKFRDEIISIEGVMTLQIIWLDIKIWWRHIFVKNVAIA